MTENNTPKTPEAGPDFPAMQAVITLLNQGRVSEGTLASAELTRQFPEHGFGWKLLGIFLKLQYQHGPALQAMVKAAQLSPNDDEACSNAGIALAEANALPEAELFLRHALTLNPHNSRCLNNLGNLLNRQGRLQDAETYQRHALQIAPNDADALGNLGCTLYDQGRTSEAAACYEQALQIDPDHAQTQWNASMEKLLRGDYVNGWRQYEWRWQTPVFHSMQRPFSQALWLGEEDVRGKTILLHAEQGLGDTLQFCRYASLVAKRGATVVLLVPAPLKALLRTLAGVSSVLTDDEPLPPFDFHCPLMSLPLAFATTVDSIPATLPYLSVSMDAIASWQQRLPQTDLPRIGVVWSGRLLHRHDYRRSIALSEFASLFSAKAQFVSLQNEVREADTQTLAAHPGLLHFGEQLKNFSDTAALIAEMDLVICVDTAVAHLAGALGKPVWLLLPFQADWRWLKDRSDSPWYPGMRLFRQTIHGDWSGVLDAVRQALKAL